VLGDILWIGLENRGFESRDGEEEALCALIFNTMGCLHEILKEREYSFKPKTVRCDQKT